MGVVEYNNALLKITTADHAVTASLRARLGSHSGWLGAFSFVLAGRRPLCALLKVTVVNHAGTASLRARLGNSSAWLGDFHLNMAARRAMVTPLRSRFGNLAAGMEV
jgi:hypothetical protein